MIHNINYENLSQEIQQKNSPEEKISPETVKTFLQEKTVFQQTQQAPQQQTAPQQDSLFLPQYAHEEPNTSRDVVTKLIQYTLEKGLEEGIAQTLKMNDPQILDMYHDTLTEKIFDEMKQRNLIG